MLVEQGKYNAVHGVTFAYASIHPMPRAPADLLKLMMELAVITPPQYRFLSRPNREFKLYVENSPSGLNVLYTYFNDFDLFEWNLL